MTYDVEFVPGPPPDDDDWGPNLDAVDADPSGPALLEAWGAISARVREVLPTGTEGGDATFRQIIDEDIGLVLTAGPEEASLSVPYWSEGDEAAAVMGTFAAVVAAVVEATGLQAFDPQTGLGFVAEPAGSVAHFDRVADMAEREGLPLGPPTARTRWWKRR